MGLTAMNDEHEFGASNVAEVPAYRRVATMLRQEIISGRTAPGSWLRLQAIAERCQVSVQPVREALQVLEGEGLIEIFPNRGARIIGLNRLRIIHMYEIREAMESFLAGRFAEEASLKDLENIYAIKRQHDLALSERDIEKASQINFIFHHTINIRSGNTQAVNICERYQELIYTLARQLGPSPDHFERIPREHHLLLDAFNARDAAAAQKYAAAHIRSMLNAHLVLFDKALLKRQGAQVSQSIGE